MQAIDLFAGAGGLSVGLKKAGFEVISAVEIDPVAADTYRANHGTTKLLQSDIKFVSSKELLLGSDSQGVALLSGCPPCQGFSSLTNKYKREDPRNKLIGEMTRLIREIKPVAIMMENVPGIAGKGHKHLGGFLSELENMGYTYNYGVLQVADYGVPQERSRFVLLAGLGFEIAIPKATHSRTGEGGLPVWRTVKQAIGTLEAPISLMEAKKLGGPRNNNWSVVRNLSPLNIQRLGYLKPGGARFDIPDELRPDCHKGNSRGFSNVYGRMSWDKPSPTITGGCTVLSKGRFGHPSEDRTISVREAARIQTFPDDYIFETDFIDRACQLIGNALPCQFAEVMARACFSAIRDKWTVPTK